MNIKLDYCYIDDGYGDFCYKYGCFVCCIDWMLDCNVVIYGYCNYYLGIGVLKN